MNKLNEKTILFLCTGNSCRSQIAEGLAKYYLENYKIFSAGTEPDPINQIAIRIMRDINIDISKNFSKKINFKNLNKYNLIITLCGDAKDNCPAIKPISKHLHWDIEDPAKFSGTDDEIEMKFSEIRDIILNKIKSLKIKLKKDLKCI